MYRARPITAGRASLILFVVVAFGLLGCIDLTLVHTTVDQPGSTPVAIQTRSREQHDVAILSVDFDPRFGGSTLSQGGAMLVAVDNRGTETERMVTVEAVLSGDTKDDIIVKMVETISVLAPGEVKIARFTATDLPPARRHYWLTVRVAPVPGETALANNTKLMRIDIVTAANRR